jgi:hypothetical protein
MLFDAYLMIDWSGGASLGPPRPTKDNIWVGELWNGGASQLYFRGRAAATDRILRRLTAHAAAGARVLVGFDFPYGYPRGLARALGLNRSAPWRAVWDALGDAIADDAMNKNNRFDVAAQFNRRIAGPGPFWGCPVGAARPELTATTKGLFEFPVAGLARLRATEAAMSGVQETWKLYGAGSVGSQALLGIPRVRELRDDPALMTISRVWPFEMGLTDNPSPGKGPFILHAEIWPGIVEVPDDARIRDETQVRLMCEWAADHDKAGTLGAWFAPLLDPQTTAAVTEEGWILGCAPGALGQAGAVAASAARSSA